LAGLAVDALDEVVDVEGRRGHPPGAGAPGRVAVEVADVVDLLLGARVGTTPKLRVALTEGEHLLLALGGVGLVRGGPAVDLVEGALAEQAHQLDARGGPDALVDVEVGVATAGRIEPLVVTTGLLEQLARHDEEVALPQAVEP